MNILVFANYYGALYKQAIDGVSQSKDIYVNHILAQQYINSFDQVKEIFEKCDVLIIQPLETHNIYNLKKLKKFLKKDIVIIRIPNLVFKGFWSAENDLHHLRKVSRSIIPFFPKINADVETYLDGHYLSPKSIIQNFQKELVLLEKYQKEIDVDFYQFFNSNYKKIPLFRTPQHLTNSFLEYLIDQVIDKLIVMGIPLIQKYKSEIISWDKEFGAFLPIINSVANALGLSYDLDSYYKYTRENYLGKLIEYERSESKDHINDYKKLSEILGTSNNLDQTSKIYIVTPSFNSTSTIDRTIASVLSQEGNFEIYFHIQDGGSTDGTVEKIKVWANRIYNRHVHIFCQRIIFSYSTEKDNGMYDAIMKGFDKFGKIPPTAWLSWINSDDYFLPGALSLFAKIDGSQNLAKSISWVTGCAATNHDSLQSSTSDRVIATDIVKNGISDGIHWQFIQQEGTFFRKKLWDEVLTSGVFQKLLYAGDWYLWFAFANNGHKLYQYKYSLASFSNRAGQLSQINKNEYYQEINNLVDIEPRREKFLSLDTNNIKALYLAPKWQDGSLYVEERGIKGHYDHLKKRFEEEKKDIIKVSNVNKEGDIDIIYNGEIIAYDKDWQFPAITEKYAYQKIKDLCRMDAQTTYIAFPWATLIDLLNTKKDGSQQLLNILKKIKEKIQYKKRVITVCQHILMLNYQDIFFDLGITDVFWTHAIKDQEYFPKYQNIAIYPFPLFPVQAVKDGVDNDRDILFSFVGARSNKWYLTNTREQIIDLLDKHPDGLVIGRDQWHYNKIVYEHQILKKDGQAKDFIDDDKSFEFKNILKKSIFSLCPSGSGPNSIRLWESLGSGAIPVILADTYLPPGDSKLWEAAAVFCNEDQQAILELPEKLKSIAQNKDLLAYKRRAMKQLWMMYGDQWFIYDIQQLIVALAQQHDCFQFDSKPEVDNNYLDNIYSNVDLITSSNADLILLSYINDLLIEYDVEILTKKWLNEDNIKVLKKVFNYGSNELIQRAKNLSKMKNVLNFEDKMV